MSYSDGCTSLSLCRTFLPVKREFFLRTVTKARAHRGSSDWVQFSLFSLYHCRVFTLQIKAPT